jgi:hypothetical protein
MQGYAGIAGKSRAPLRVTHGTIHAFSADADLDGFLALLERSPVEGGLSLLLRRGLAVVHFARGDIDHALGALV